MEINASPISDSRLTTTTLARLYTQVADVGSSYPANSSRTIALTASADACPRLVALGVGMAR